MLLYLLILYSMAPLQHQNEVKTPLLSLPLAVSAELATEPMRSQYAVSERVNPFYVWGNIDRDNFPDYAVLLKRRRDDSEVIVLFLSTKHEPVVLYDSLKIEHPPVQGWEICHWSTCGELWAASRPKFLQNLRRKKRDSLILSFGGQGRICYWSGKTLTCEPWGE
jgi:hypothetical protein